MPDVEKSIEHVSAPEASRIARTALVQLHVWTRPEDVMYLRQIAAERDQTVSAVVRSIVRAYRRARMAQGVDPARPAQDADRATVSGEPARRRFATSGDESGTAAVRARYIRP